jgi:hypothetical protein
MNVGGTSVYQHVESWQRASAGDVLWRGTLVTLTTLLQLLPVHVWNALAAGTGCAGHVNRRKLLKSMSPAAMHAHATAAWECASFSC